MKKKSNHKYNDLTNLVLFPAEDTLKAEQGNLWSGAAKEDKINTRKGKFAKVDEYQKRTTMTPMPPLEQPRHRRAQR